MGNLICPHTNNCEIYLRYRQDKIGSNIDVINNNFKGGVYNCYALEYVNKNPKKKPSCIESSLMKKDLGCLHLEILNKLTQLTK